MSHGDYLAQVPDGFQLIRTPPRRLSHESRGVLRRAVPSGGQSYGPRAGDAAQFPLCGLPVWTMRNYMKTAIADVREKVGDGKVLALSGGVDSSVAAALLAKAVGERLTCIFVDHVACCAKTRVNGLQGCLPGFRDALYPCQRPAALYGAAGRRRAGAGAEAEDHRRGVYPRL